MPAIENSMDEVLGKIGKGIAEGVKVGLKAGKGLYREVKPFAKEFGKATEETLLQAGRIRRAYRGEISPREEHEHEERLAEIRAGRREPSEREVVIEVYVSNVPFSGTSSPLSSEPMREEVRKAKWRRKRKTKKS